VIGIAKYDLSLRLSRQVAVKDSFNSCSRTDGHENRGLNLAVVGGDSTRARLTIGGSMFQSKFHSMQKYVFFAGYTIFQRFIYINS
jgi:hypothetical protein